MKPKATSEWSGNIYSRDSGNTYYATIAMKGPNSLQVQACVLGHFFCSGNVWSRIDIKPMRMITSPVDFVGDLTDHGASDHAEHDRANECECEIRGNDAQSAGEGHGKPPWFMSLFAVTRKSGKTFQPEKVSLAVPSATSVGGGDRPRRG